MARWCNARARCTCASTGMWPMATGRWRQRASRCSPVTRWWRASTRARSGSCASSTRARTARWSASSCATGCAGTSTRRCGPRCSVSSPCPMPSGRGGTCARFPPSRWTPPRRASSTTPSPCCPRAGTGRCASSSPSRTRRSSSPRARRWTAWHVSGPPACTSPAPCCPCSPRSSRWTGSAWCPARSGSASRWSCASTPRGASPRRTCTRASSARGHG
jgi:hypothetical protein